MAQNRPGLRSCRPWAVAAEGTMTKGKLGAYSEAYMERKRDASRSVTWKSGMRRKRAWLPDPVEWGGSV